VADRSKLAEKDFWNHTPQEIGAALGCGLEGLGGKEARQTARSVWGRTAMAAAKADSLLRGRVAPIARTAVPDSAGRRHHLYSNRRHHRRFDHRAYPDAVDRTRYDAGRTRGKDGGNPAAGR